MKPAALSALACMFLLPTAVIAQPVSGLYIGAKVGANFAGSFESSQNNTKISTDVGPVGLASIGWSFGNGLRAEIEGSYRSNNISNISTLRNNGVFESLGNPSGTAVTYAAMANVLYDIPLHPFGLPLQPYVGAGLGYGRQNLNNAKGNGFSSFQYPATTVGPVPTAVSFGSAGAFAYQVMIGAAFPLKLLPGFAFTLEYRFFGMTNASVPVNRVNTVGDRVNGVLAGSTAQNDFKMLDSAVLVGIRYDFGAPATPVEVPVSVPATLPARSFLVFFDWDKSTLTDRARQIVAEAASSATKTQYTRIEINGYTDTSGTAQDNMNLSVRRAEAVAAELVKDGVSRQAISITGFGQTHLLVPTADGVREPQNRRVEIVIR